MSESGAASPVEPLVDEGFERRGLQSRPRHRLDLVAGLCDGILTVTLPQMGMCWRSEHESLFHQGLLSNKPLLGTVL